LRPPPRGPTLQPWPRPAAGRPSAAPPTRDVWFCGVSTSPPERYFGLKFFAGDQTFTIQLSDKAWTITDKSKYGVSMRLDNNRVWTTSAEGMHFPDGDPGLEYSIRKDELARFNQEFGSSKTLRLQFTNGMNDWAIDLAAARQVNSKFAECNAKLK
jgi:hypothetical protein